MNRSLELAVTLLGALCIFVVAFLGFAALSGVPISSVAVIGKLFPPEAAPAEETAEAPEHADEPPAFTDHQVVEANLGLLGAYSIEPPFSAKELQALASDLKTAKAQYLERLQSVAEREKAMREREDLLEQRFETLDELRDELERYEATLAARQLELEGGGEAAKITPEQWAEIAQVFQGQKPADMATRLLEFPPDDAAHILGNLDDADAAKLLNALPPDRWKDYVDAYSRSTRVE